jgi:hypothetical protein
MSITLFPVGIKHGSEKHPFAPTTRKRAERRGLKYDRDWLAENPSRDYRIRAALPLEFDEWRTRYVVAARLPDGHPFQIDCHLLPLSADDEQTAARIFHALLSADELKRQYYEWARRRTARQRARS